MFPKNTLIMFCMIVIPLTFICGKKRNLLFQISKTLPFPEFAFDLFLKFSKLGCWLASEHLLDIRSHSLVNTLTPLGCLLILGPKTQKKAFTIHLYQKISIWNYKMHNKWCYKHWRDSKEKKSKSYFVSSLLSLWSSSSTMMTISFQKSLFLSRSISLKMWKQNVNNYPIYNLC